MSRPDLIHGERTTIFHCLLEGSKDGKPAEGKIKESSLFYGCHWKKVSRVWKDAKKLKAQGLPVIFNNKKKEAVRPKKHVPDFEAIKLIEGVQRQKIRDFAMRIHTSKSTIGRWMLADLLKYRTDSMKPCLTGPCICLGSVPGEEEEYRSGNKQHIPKVNLICGVAKPLYTVDKECLFDGKIGVWAFTERVQAARSSRNRPAGTWITKPLDSINKILYKDTLINKIIPAIKEKCPHMFLGNEVFIQQDNAPTHIKDDDHELRTATSADGWNIKLICQPANSPDLNINDLGWFRSLQSLQHKTLMRNVDELIAAVQDSYVALSDTTLSDVFLSLQAVMIEILKARGHNNYKLPHLKKNTLRIQRTLTDNLEVDPNLVRDCMLYLMEEGNESEMEELTQTLGVSFLLV